MTTTQPRSKSGGRSLKRQMSRRSEAVVKPIQWRVRSRWKLTRAQTVTSGVDPNRTEAGRFCCGARSMREVSDLDIFRCTIPADFRCHVIMPWCIFLQLPMTREEAEISAGRRQQCHRQA